MLTKPIMRQRKFLKRKTKFYYAKRFYSNRFTQTAALLVFVSMEVFEVIVWDLNSDQTDFVRNGKAIKYYCDERNRI